MNAFFSSFAKIAGTSCAKIAKQINDESEYACTIQDFSECFGRNPRSSKKTEVIRTMAGQKLNSAVFQTVKQHVPSARPSDVFMADTNGNVYVFANGKNGLTLRGQFTPE